MTFARKMAKRTMRMLLWAALASAIAGVGSGRARASILQAAVASGMEDVLAGAFDEQSSSSPEAANTPVPEQPYDPSTPTEHESGFVVDLQSSTTGTSSSAPSSGGAGTAPPCVISATLSLHENPFVARLADRRALFLPSPPGLDLLRPPQH